MLFENSNLEVTSHDVILCDITWYDNIIELGTTAPTYTTTGGGHVWCDGPNGSQGAPRLLGTHLDKHSCIVILEALHS